MRQVDRATFWKAIGPLDVEGQVNGRYADPKYGTTFRLKSTREIVGKTVNVGQHPHYKPDCIYFLAEGL